MSFLPSLLSDFIPYEPDPEPEQNDCNSFLSRRRKAILAYAYMLVERPRPQSRYPLEDNEPRNVLQRIKLMVDRCRLPFDELDQADQFRILFKSMEKKYLRLIKRVEWTTRVNGMYHKYFPDPVDVYGELSYLRPSSRVAIPCEFDKKSPLAILVRLLRTRFEDTVKGGNNPAAILALRKLLSMWELKLDRSTSRYGLYAFITSNRAHIEQFLITLINIAARVEDLMDTSLALFGLVYDELYYKVLHAEADTFDERDLYDSPPRNADKALCILARHQLLDLVKRVLPDKSMSDKARVACANIVCHRKGTGALLDSVTIVAIREELLKYLLVVEGNESIRVLRACLMTLDSCLSKTDEAAHLIAPIETGMRKAMIRIMMETAEVSVFKDAWRRYMELGWSNEVEGLQSLIDTELALSKLTLKVRLRNWKKFDPHGELVSRIITSASSAQLDTLLNCEGFLKSVMNWDGDFEPSRYILVVRTFLGKGSREQLSRLITTNSTLVGELLLMSFWNHSAECLDILARVMLSIGFIECLAISQRADSILMPWFHRFHQALNPSHQLLMVYFSRALANEQLLKYMAAADPLQFQALAVSGYLDVMVLLVGQCHIVRVPVPKVWLPVELWKRLPCFLKKEEWIVDLEEFCFTPESI